MIPASAHVVEFYLINKSFIEQVRDFFLVQITNNYIKQKFNHELPPKDKLKACLFLYFQSRTWVVSVGLKFIRSNNIFKTRVKKMTLK